MSSKTKLDTEIKARIAELEREIKRKRFELEDYTQELECLNNLKELRCKNNKNNLGLEIKDIGGVGYIELTPTEVLEFLHTKKDSYFVYPEGDTAELRFVLSEILKSDAPLSSSTLSRKVEEAGLDKMNYLNRLKGHIARNPDCKIVLFRNVDSGQVEYYH